MRRREFVATVPVVGTTLTAGCAGSGSQETDGTADEPTESGSKETDGTADEPAETESSTPGESDVITEIEFEKREGPTAVLIVTVSDIVSEVNVVSQDGRQIGGATFPTGVTRSTLVSGTTFNLENAQFVALDNEGKEIETVTRTFLPELTYSNFYVDGEFETEVVDGETRYWGSSDKRQWHITVTNSGNAPVFVNGVGIYPTPRDIGYPEQEKPSLVGDHFLQPGESIEHSGSMSINWDYNLQERDGVTYIGQSTTEWDESSYCRGETRTLRLWAEDDKGESYTQEIPIIFGGELAKHSTSFGDGELRTCTEFSSDA